MRVLWLGGWASHVACWGERIEREMPGVEHTYLDTHSLIDMEEQPVPLRGGGQPFEAGIAWSMGCLYLLQWLVKSKPSPNDLPLWICCNPILHFCHPYYGWSPRVLSRMRRHLEKSSEKVLNDFWNIMSQGGEAEELRKPWLQQGKSYGVESLQRGLDYLESTVVEAESLKPYRERLLFLVATKDAVVQFSNNIQLNEFSSRTVEASHLLPLTHPQSLLQCLPLT